MKLAPPELSAPAAKRVPKETSIHGDTRVDNYFWLRDRDDPDTTAYLEAENRYTESVMKPTEPLQESLYAEMLGRIKQTDVSVPLKRDEFYYYTRTEEGKAYAIYCRKHVPVGTSLEDAAEQVLLDANALAEGHKYCRVGNFAPSPDHRLLAYSVDFDGDETYTIRVKDLATGVLLPDEIPNTYYTLEWAEDNATFFYTVLDETLRPYKVFRHRLGMAQDELAYHEADERFTLGIAKTLTHAFVLISSDSPVTSELRILDASEPLGEFHVLLPRVQGVEYDVTHHTGDRAGETRDAGGTFFIRINDIAETFRVVQVPAANPAKEHWEEIIPGRAGITIESVEAFRDHLVTEERHRGLTEIYIRRFADGATHAIEFPEPVYTAGVAENAEFDSTSAAVRVFVAGHADFSVRLRDGRAHVCAAKTAGGAGRLRSRALPVGAFVCQGARWRGDSDFARIPRRF